MWTLISRLPRNLARKIALIPGAVDVHINQEVNTPAINLDIDRSKASQAGMTQRDVANSMLISLSSSGQTAPNQWLNPVNGVNYNDGRTDAAIPHQFDRRHPPHSHYVRSAGATRSC